MCVCVCVCVCVLNLNIMFYKCIWYGKSNNSALTRNNNVENKTQFINTSLLNFIPSMSIKLYLNWHNQNLNQINCILTVNGEVTQFTTTQPKLKSK